MKNNIFIYLFLICIILVFSFYNTYTHLNESFTPAINSLYRPYLRTARNYTENFYNNTNTHFKRFLRKTGLY